MVFISISTSAEGSAYSALILLWLFTFTLTFTLLSGLSRVVVGLVVRWAVVGFGYSWAVGFGHRFEWGGQGRASEKEEEQVGFDLNHGEVVNEVE